MCEIIKGEEVAKMLNITLEEIKLRKLLTGLQRIKDIVDHNHSVVSEALDRLIEAMYAELDEIAELWEKNDVR